MQTHRPGPLCMKSEPRPWNLAKQCSSEPVRATVEALQPACRENMSFTLMISPLFPSPAGVLSVASHSRVFTKAAKKLSTR